VRGERVGRDDRPGALQADAPVLRRREVVEREREQPAKPLVDDQVLEGREPADRTVRPQAPDAVDGPWTPHALSDV